MTGDIRPNTLAAPGERAARARVEAVFEAIDRLSTADLNSAPVPRVDLDGRAARLDRVHDLAAGLGRGALLDDALGAVRDAVLDRIGDMRPYPYAVNPTGAARVEDQAAIVAALQDLVAVAVVEDRLDPAEAAQLAAPGRQLVGLRGDDDADEPPEEKPEVASVGAPSRADWSVADREAHASAYSPPGTRAMRRIFFVVAAVVGVLAALATGIGGGDWLLALGLAAAVVALCWTFATWSPRG